MSRVGLQPTSEKQLAVLDLLSGDVDDTALPPVITNQQRLDRGIGLFLLCTRTRKTPKEGEEVEFAGLVVG